MITDIDAALKHLKMLPLPVSASMLDVVKQLSSYCVLLRVTHFLLHVSLTPPLSSPSHPTPPPPQSHDPGCVVTVTQTHRRRVKGREDGEGYGGCECGRRRCGSITVVTSYYSLLPITHTHTRTHICTVQHPAAASHTSEKQQR